MIICVTGPMAAGKNAAAAILERKGFSVVDADILAHTAVENRKDAIVDRFSAEAEESHISLITSEGKLDRRALGRLIFAKQELLEEHEKLVHPEINRLLEDFIEQNKSHDIVINATVLYKVAVMQRCDSVIFVDAPRIIRFFRVKKRDHMKTAQIFARFKAQSELFAKYNLSNADIYKVWNTGNLTSLEKKLDQILIQCR